MFLFFRIQGEKMSISRQRYYMRGSIYPREETTYEELKGHRSFSKEELPRLSQTGTIGYGNRPSRQFISKYACGMLNTGKGGLISMGILDTGRIEVSSFSKKFR